MVIEIEQTAADLFDDAGKTGAMLKQVDWAQTTFDSVGRWSQSLRTAVQICMSAPSPMAIWWTAADSDRPATNSAVTSSDLICNDAYHFSLGLTDFTQRRHLPQFSQTAFGILSAVKTVLATGQAARSDYQLRVLSPFSEQTISEQTSEDLKPELQPTAEDERRCFKLSYSPLYDCAGIVKGVFATAIETTAQKRAELIQDRMQAEVRQCEVVIEQVKEQSAEIAQRQISGILENISDAFIAFDRDWRYTFVNKKAAQLLHQDVQSLVGQPVCQDDFPNRVGTVTFTELHRAMTNNVPVVFEEYNASFDTWFEVHGYPSAEGLAIYFQDVSDRKRIETDREQRLVEAQKARKEAEAASRLKDEFLSVVSHELRSPLNPILGCAKLLKRDGLTPERRQQALSSIERNAQIQAQLVNDLLDVSRILRGELSLNICPVPVVPAIEAAIKKVSTDANRKNISIATHYNAQVNYVLADPGRLQQVVWNLLSNAVKFTPRSGRVDIYIEQIANQMKISVVDTGKGIKQSFLPYVFDRFRQEDSAITRRFGGLGLGLSIVRHLVELQQGSVEASSLGEGQGATFSVYLPLSGAPEKADRNTASKYMLNRTSARTSNTTSPKASSRVQVQPLSS